MRDWRVDLDRYLTTPPEDTYTEYYEQVVDKISDTFFDENEVWLLESQGTADKWIYKLFNKGLDPAEAALVVERAFKFWKIK